MITTAGRNHIKRFIAGQVPQIANLVGFGVGATAANLADTRLNLEAARKPVLSINADLVNDRLVFKAKLDPNDIGSIYEIGLWAGTGTGGGARRLGYLSPTSVWGGGTLSTTNARAGTQTLTVTAAASATGAAINGVSREDLTRFSDTDTFIFGFTATANCAAVRVRIGADASNYYEFLLNAPVTGYNTYRVLRSAATKVGSPTWDTSYVTVRPTATSAGATTITMDAFFVEDTTNTSGDILVARSVLATPTVTEATLPTEVEYSLGINIT